jgi:hypothetical protein
MIVAKHFLPPGIIQPNYITSRFSKKEIAITLVSTGSTSVFGGVCRTKKRPPRIGTAFFLRVYQADACFLA